VIVDPDFLDHWRTRMLVDALGGDECAPMYVIRVWAHCQQRRGDSFAMPAAGLRGLCPEALDKNMKLLHRMGLAYRRKFDTTRELREDGTYKGGPAPVLWSWNQVPFKNRDFQEQA
jgi:hypothetical protein